MTGWWVVRLSLVVVGVLGLGIAAVAPRDRSPAIVDVAASRPPIETREITGLDSLGKAVVMNDLFRPSRSEPGLPYDPAWPVGAEVILATAPERPSLRLTGVIWGNAPLAVVEGLSGNAVARAVAVGDVFGGLTVRRIGMDGVVITAADTTWTLTIKEPWQ